LNSPVVQLAIALLGGALLVWMGSDMLWGALSGKIRLPSASADAERLGNGQLVRMGVLTTLSNPFWYAWWVTAVPNYLVELNAVLPVSIAAFYFGHISADFAWDSMLSGIVAGGRRWITDPVYRTIIVVCGGFFLYLGLKFLWQGINLL